MKAYLHGKGSDASQGGRKEKVTGSEVNGLSYSSSEYSVQGTKG